MPARKPASTIESDPIAAPQLVALVTLAPATALRNTIQPSADVVPLTVKGMAGQTADVFQAQDSVANVLAAVTTTGFRVMRAGVPSNYLEFISSGGTANIKGVGQPQMVLSPNGNTRLTLNNTASPTAQVDVGSASAIGLIIKGSAAQAQVLTQWLDSAGSQLAAVTQAGRIDSSGGQGFSWGGNSHITRNAANGLITWGLQGISTAGVLVINGHASAVPWVIKAAAAQTADLFQAQDSAGAVKAYVAPSGSALFAGYLVSTNGGAAQVRMGGFGPSSEAAIQFGSAQDVNLYRSAADTLKTDDSLVVGGANGIDITTAGKGIKLKSQDGLTTKTLTIDNAGALALI